MKALISMLAELLEVNGGDVLYKSLSSEDIFQEFDMFLASSKGSYRLEQFLLGNQSLGNTFQFAGDSYTLLMKRLYFLILESILPFNLGKGLRVKRYMGKFGF